MPRADRQSWDELVQALRRDRQALHLARSSGTLDVDELADLLELVLAQLHWMARANRNSLGDVPDRVRRLEDRMHPGRQLRRWWAARRRTSTTSAGTAPPAPLRVMYGSRRCSRPAPNVLDAWGGQRGAAASG